MRKITITLILLILSYSPACAETYFLRSDGSGNKAAAAGTGTGSCGAAGTAMSIATHDGETYAAGDTIYLCDTGGIFRDKLDVPSSGSIGNPITYTAASGDSPKIYGSTEVSTWSTTGGNLWTATSASDPESLWIVLANGTIVWGEDMAAVEPSAEHQWYYVGTTITLYALSDPDDYTSVEKATRLQGFNINRKSYITVSNLNISFCGGATSNEAAGVYTDAGVSPGTYGIIVEYNTIHHIGKMSVTASTGHQGMGVSLSNTSDSFIRYNDISYCGRRGVCLWVNNASRVMDDTSVYGNKIYNNHHAQLDCFWQTSGGTFDNIAIFNNYFYTDANLGEGATLKAEVHGINLESNCGEKMSNFKVYNNVISNMYGPASIYVRGTEGLLIYNNTIYSARPYSGYLYGILINDNKAAGNTTVTLKNNIVFLASGSAGALNVTDMDYITACENNLWYNTSGEPFAVIETTEYHSDDQAGYKTATTWDDTGLWEDPVFVSDGDDLTLQVTSPCIGAGTDIGNGLLYGLDPTSTWPDNVKPVDQDLYGDWEIGAYVYDEDVTPPTFVSATINTAGTTLTIVFDEAVTFGAGGNAGWTFDMDGGSGEGLTYLSGDESDSLVYTITGRTIEYGETGTLDYTQPGNGVEDIALNDFVSIGTPEAVVNNSTESSRRGMAFGGY